MNHSFSFHAHTPLEVLNYAIRRRGDADWLIQEMEDLRVRECPFPFSEDDRRVYMVGQNGNHRSALYKAIGLPDIMLNRVSRIESFNIDIYFIQRYPINLINFLIQEGLLQEDNGKYKDIFGYLIWILPDHRISYENQIIELCARARWVNKILNPSIPARYRFLESEHQVIKKLSEGHPPFTKSLNEYLLKAKLGLAKFSSRSNTLDKKREVRNNEIIEKLN